jgi:hypothetical protein
MGVRCALGLGAEAQVVHGIAGTHLPARDTPVVWEEIAVYHFIPDGKGGGKELGLDGRGDARAVAFKHLLLRAVNEPHALEHRRVLWHHVDLRPPGRACRPMSYCWLLSNSHLSRPCAIYSHLSRPLTISRPLPVLAFPVPRKQGAEQVLCSEYQGAKHASEIKTQRDRAHVRVRAYTHAHAWPSHGPRTGSIHPSPIARPTRGMYAGLLGANAALCL